MNDASLRRKGLPVLSLLMVGIFFAGTLSLCGCETLKKKFIRQKKKDKDNENNFVPVLQPEEYPEKVKTPAQTYRYHYSLFRVWDKDFRDAIYTRNSDKKQLYLVDQLTIQLEAMKNLLQGDKQTGLSVLIKKLDGVREQLKKPSAMRDYNDITRDLNFVERKILNNYKFNAIESSLTQ